MIDPDLLAILGCPLEPDRPPLREQGNLLICTSCGSGFRVVDGIPDLLPEDAVPPEKVGELFA
jgi:uncharacterized protein YbaR (Trm112 family)